MRIKINFYPYTDTVKEHQPHFDYDFDHYGAIFSLNTCNGFTRLKDGSKFDSFLTGKASFMYSPNKNKNLKNLDRKIDIKNIFSQIEVSRFNFSLSPF